MKTVQVNGITLEYEATGTGEPVLLISPVLPDGFLPLLAEPALASRHRLIRYHKRGWVGSTHPTGAVSVADHVADARALLEHLGIARAHVVGHSSGALVAMQMAIDAPRAVHSLALLEPSFLSVPAADAFLKAAQPAFEHFAAGRKEQAFAAFMTGASGLPWDECRAILEKRMPGSVAQSVADADTLFGVELPGLMEWRFDAEAAKKIVQPTLSFVGARTQQLWIEVAERLRTWLPRVEERTIDDVGHLLHLQRPSPVANALADFFAKHPLGR
jgi:pimeloyl-ACP methyl ester carboxylesterase